VTGKTGCGIAGHPLSKGGRHATATKAVDHVGEQGRFVVSGVVASSISPELQNRCNTR
jgi:hypothetical protein